MISKLNPRTARKHLQEFRFADLFVEDLGWNYPGKGKPLSITHDTHRYIATEISQLSGFRVFEVCTADADTPFPDAKTQAVIWKHIAPQAVENILIFIDPPRERSVWLWMKRSEGKTRPRRHHYLKGQPGDLFLSKLSSLVIDLSELDEDGNIPITETAARVRAGLDIETVTKAFFKDFQEEHAKLLESIGGIPDPRERRWYASVLLNRLMFIWFLQRKSFLDGGNLEYLPEKLTASGKLGKNLFFKSLLRDLFFEGFAKPEEKRSPIGEIPLGDIPYLNGGLFLPHGIEARIEGDSLHTAAYSTITVPDECFTDLFALFSRYSWSLNDTPGGDDREINPDVLGYIFEKYINQKEFGAYYTRPEITDYLCEQTVHQLVLDRVNEGFQSRMKLHEADPKGFRAPHLYDSIEDLLLHATGPIAQKVLQDILPRLSLLDPACGSGAFLVAAQKTLLNLYTALIGRCEALAHKPVLQWMDTERKKHKAPAAYWLKKKIVTENLYGVDLMEEATEIAKLRLFLSLVASAEKRDQLEPLPNIEFNLLPGNSLIGLLHVDPKNFDSRSGISTPTGKRQRLQQAGISLIHKEDLGFETESTHVPTTKEVQQLHIAAKQAAKYEELLRRKNDRIRLYKESTATFKDLAGLKRDIDLLKKEAREILDSLLLDQFNALGIKFEQATWDQKKKKEGKPEKRPLRISDIQALHPFHWAYEFDEIIVNRGGFDAIITNPPWENFKPDAKEFFQKHSVIVTKNLMRLEEFVAEKSAILTKDSEIQESWLKYLSGFPHVNLYFRNASQYSNQTAIINGRKATTDLNLYKLFTEQCTHLVAVGGRCGIVIPSGIYTDLGTTQLRRMLFTKTRLTGLYGFENRKKIFEGVDTRFKFVVLSFENGNQTCQFPVAFMRQEVSELEVFPSSTNLFLDLETIRKLSPDSLSLMEFNTSEDLTTARKFLKFPMLGEVSKACWNFKLKREFHLRDDSIAGIIVGEGGDGTLPLLTGKMFHQFRLTEEDFTYWVTKEDGEKSLAAGRSDFPTHMDYQCYRWVHRRIASNTNERTLITTIAPPNVFTEVNSPTLNIPASCVNLLEMIYLCSVTNSFLVDWYLRKKVTTTLNNFYLYQLPIPRLTAADPDFRPLVERAARLVGTAPEFDELLAEVFGKKATHKTHGVIDPQDRLTLRAQIDALVARLYDLTIPEFQHILTTFPLVDESVKSQTLNAYRELVKLGKFTESQ